MKSVISCTADEKYSYFIPIVTWAWNRLGVGVILFLPESSKRDKKIQLGLNCMNYGYKENHHYYFDMPKHKEATAAQCVRLYGACLDLPEDELLISSDIDMCVFFKFWEDGVSTGADISILGSDLVPKGQIPMCYIYGNVKTWRSTFKINGRTYQQCLDDLLGNIDSASMRGDYWSKDQEEAARLISESEDNVYYFDRARPGTQFANNRVDRDDINWRSYVNNDLIDAHLWRPGYTDENHAKIMELMKMKFPNEDFTWLDEYQKKYKKIL